MTAIASHPARGRGRPKVSSIYGPVYSWRYQLSLGIDLLMRDSICSMQCAYCQLGRINVHTRTRALYVPTRRVLDDLAEVDLRPVNVVAFSGSGEPTLASNLGEAVTAVRKNVKKPIVVLTNATLLSDAAVRRELATADVVACKLDAYSEESFGRLNRPVSGISFSGLVDGIRKFRIDYTGRLAIQVMLLPANEGEIDRFAELIAEIAPDEVQVNVPSRARPREWSLATRGDHREFLAANAFRLLPRERVEGFAKSLATRTGVRVIAPPHASM